MREVLTSMRRTPYQTMAAFLVLFFTLFLSSVLFLSMSFLHSLLSYVETRPQVSVYFQSKTDENTIFKVRDELMATNKILSLKYVSKEDAFKAYKDLNKDNPLLLEMVSSDILPASLEVYTKKPEYLPEIANYLKTQPGVDEVNFPKDITDRLLKLTSILRQTTIVLFVYLLLMSVIVLTTTTLFKIALRKDEIELLRLLGASKFYIKKPFLAEGLVYGLVASTVSFIVLMGLLAYAYPSIVVYLKGMPSLFLNLGFTQLEVWPIKLPFLAIIYCIVTFFGVFIATIANLIATGKYLKENTH